MIRNESTSKWEPAIVKSTEQHRSAIVETPQGKTLRRNRIDIRPVPPKQVRFEVPASETQPTQHQSPEEVSQKAGTMIQCSTLCTQRKVTKFPCFWCLVFGAQFQHFLEFVLPSFFAMQLALVSMITVTLISSLSVFSLQRTRRFRTRGD